MNTRLAKFRSKAFLAQSQRCYYCGFLIWISNPEAFAAELSLTKKQTLYLQCTAEHLHARCDGGGNESANIVAACWRCNQMRHRRPVAPEPEAYLSLVRRRVGVGKWHPAPLHAAR